MKSSGTGWGVWMHLDKNGRKKLAKLMVIQEKSQRMVAKAAGYESHTHVGALLRGTKTGVTPQAAVAIAKYLGVDVSDLFVTTLSSDAAPVKMVGRGRAA